MLFHAQTWPALLTIAMCSSLGVTTPAEPASTEGSGTSRYEVRFVPAWNPATHPLEYPLAHARKGLLTPPIGATHDCDYRIFAPGTKPTPGLERLSEMGKHDPLDAEIGTAIEKGNASSIIRFADGSPGPVHPTIATTFEVTKDQSLVSLVGMIAPSPDWFYGVSSVELRRKNGWEANLVVPAYAWDSGGDKGKTYMAEDMDTSPKEVTRKAVTGHFVRDGEPRPVGFFVFKQIP